MRDGQYLASSESCRTSAGISGRWVQSRTGEIGLYTIAQAVKLWSSLPRVSHLYGLKS